MIVLGGITLPKDMQWVDRFQTTGIAQNSLRTLGGKQITYAQRLHAGTSITVEAQIDMGWVTKLMYDNLFALADVVGATYTFDFFGETHNVMFRHEEAPAVQFQPLQNKQTLLSTDYMIGVIKLKTV